MKLLFEASMQHMTNMAFRCVHALIVDILRLIEQSAFRSSLLVFQILTNLNEDEDIETPENDQACDRSAENDNGSGETAAQKQDF